MNKEKSIDWVICTAGRGSRFFKHGITVPKSKISFNSKSFLERSLSCLDLLPQDQVIVISDKAHNLSANLDKIKKDFPWVPFKHIELDQCTTGQLATFYTSRDYLRKDSSLVIWNCDTFFKSQSLNKHLRNENFDGLVPCGKLPGNHWSFFKTTPENIVLEVAEKRKISDWASVGFYHFHDITEVLNLTKEILCKDPTPEQSEHYVSALYPGLIKNKRKYYVCPVDVFLPFGTPAELEEFWGVSMQKLREENLL